MKTCMGIDPGLTGGIALLVDGVFVGAWQMPVEAKKTKGNQVDATALLELGTAIRHVIIEKNVDDRAGRFIIAVERTSAAPVFGKGKARMGSSLASGFSMGDSFACARMLAATFGAAQYEVAPVTWKAKLKLGRNKGHAISLAHRLYPTSRQVITLKKHDGLAEALLIAHYAHSFL